MPVQISQTADAVSSVRRSKFKQFETRNASSLPCGGRVDVSNDDRVSSADGVVSACVRWSLGLNFAPETAAIVHKCS